MARSVRPIRAAIRVLNVLSVLNARAPAAAPEIARDLKISRATCYRFLETLVDAGFAAKDEQGRYTPTHQVRALSCGFEDEAWLADCARSVVHGLGRELIWPIAISTLSGPAMLLRDSTDAESPLAVNRFSPGRRVSLVGTASGLAYLAFCPRTQRDTLLDVLATSENPEDAPAQDRAAILRELTAIRERGYATSRRPGRITAQCAIAVPVVANGRLLATLSVRYAESAVNVADARTKFLPKLRTAAQRIGQAFEEAAGLVGSDASAPAAELRPALVAVT